MHRSNFPIQPLTESMSVYECEQSQDDISILLALLLTEKPPKSEPDS